MSAITNSQHGAISVAAATPQLRLLPGAEGAFDQVMLCKAVIALTPDVSTFVLEPLTPQNFTFEPGQYVVLTVEIDGEQHERCYTISSPPTRPHLLTITVKRVPNGVVSNWLHDSFGVGQQALVRGPLGEFSLVNYPALKYLFLSAGSGVTPMLSMTRTLADLAEDCDVAFVHSARSPVDIIARSELATLANSGLALAVTSICEADSPEERWAGPRGRLTAPLLAACVPDVAAREVFICGPPPYMKAAHAVLAELGVDPGHVHQESFTLDVPAVPLTAVPDGPAEVDREVGTASLYFRRSGIDVACPPGTTVLEAATAAGVVIRSSCGQGLCGTCKSDLVSGQVDMQHAGGIRPREIAAGKFLPCCSYPTGDLVVDA